MALIQSITLRATTMEAIIVAVNYFSIAELARIII